jgi:hypothetical protein
MIPKGTEASFLLRFSRGRSLDPEKLQELEKNAEELHVRVSRLVKVYEEADIDQRRLAAEDLELLQSYNGGTMGITPSYFTLAVMLSRRVSDLREVFYKLLGYPSNVKGRSRQADRIGELLDMVYGMVSSARTKFLEAVVARKWRKREEIERKIYEHLMGGKGKGQERKGGSSETAVATVKDGQGNVIKVYLETKNPLNLLILEEKRLKIRDETENSGDPGEEPRTEGAAIEVVSIVFGAQLEEKERELVEKWRFLAQREKDVEELMQKVRGKNGGGEVEKSEQEKSGGLDPEKNGGGLRAKSSSGKGGRPENGSEELSPDGAVSAPEPISSASSNYQRTLTLDISAPMVPPGGSGEETDSEPIASSTHFPVGLPVPRQLSRKPSPFPGSGPFGGPGMGAGSSSFTGHHGH